MAKLLHLHGWYDPACSQPWLQARVLWFPEDPVSVTFLGLFGPKCALMSGSLAPGTPRGLAWKKC